MVKIILGFPNYAISTAGDVYNIKRNKLLKSVVNKGYMCVCLYRNNKKYKKDIHRLVLETFVSKCPKGMESIHKNGDKRNNRLSNLKWGTHSENMLDKNKHGTGNYRCGERHHKAKLTEQEVKEIWKLWWNGMYTQTDIAKIYNAHPVTIHYILRNKTWKHIWDK